MDSRKLLYHQIPAKKTSVQTNNYTTLSPHESLYAAKTKYRRQQILSMTVQRPACTQQSPTSYIQEFGAMNVLIDDNRDNIYIEQQLQEYLQTQQTNVIILQYKTKYELVRYIHEACFSPVPSKILKAVKKKHLLTWTGLDANNFQNLPTHVIATVKVHMKHEGHHLQFTKKQPTPQTIKTAQEEK